MNPKTTFNAKSWVTPIGRLSLVLSLICATHISFAQETEEGEEDIFELSPFVVSTQETGWYATETLSGSRLRTKFDDVASQVEVLTMEFMDDFGVNSIEEASIYSLNAENSEEYLATDDGRQSLSGSLRIRGISNATRGREFFAAYMKPDNYNLERVTLSSGPNAILFGTGSPGGVVNTTIARARFDDSFQFKVQFDSWNSKRYQFMANREIIEDVLAVKVAAVYDDRQFELKPSGEISRRFYGTAMYKPFKKTSISFHIEDVEIESRRPVRNLPYDRVSVWANAGDLGSVYPNEYIFPNDTAWITGGTGIADGNVFSQHDARPTLLIGPNPAGVPSVQSYNNTVVPGLRTNYGGVNDPLVDPVNVDNRGTTFVDGSYYPTTLNQLYYNESERDHNKVYNIFLNQEILENLYLEAAWQREDYGDSLGTWMTFNSSTQLTVDPNQFLPDGVTPNPYVGELYFEGDGKYERGERDRDEYRLALSYDFDFKDHFDNVILRNLGRHRLAGLYNNRQSESINQEYKPRIVPKFNEATGLYYDPQIPNFPYFDAARPLIDSVDPLNLSQGTDRTFHVRNYVTLNGNYSIIQPPFDLLNGQPISFLDANGEEWILDPENAAVGTNGERLTTGRNTVGVKDKITTAQFAYTGYFFDDRLVYTFGYREDELESADEIAPEWTWLNRETGTTQSGGFIAHRSLYGYEKFGSEDTDRDSGITRYHGVVLHPFRGWRWKLPLGADLSLHYSKSDTFQANTPRVDANGITVPGEQGEGEDYGFSLSLFKNKFSMRFNRFKVTSSPSIGAFNGIRGRIRPTVRNLLYGFGAADPNGDGTPAFQDYEEFTTLLFPDWPFLDDPSADARKIYPFWASDNFNTGDFGNELDPYTTIASAEATGTEITIRVSPIDNLDIRFTYTEQEVIQTDIAGNWMRFIDKFTAFMDNSPNTLFVEGYNPADNQAQYTDPNGFDMDGLDLDPNDGLAPGIDYFRWDQIPNGGSENSRALTDPNTPWGQDDLSTTGGWTRTTLRERFIEQAVNSNQGVNFVQSLEGRPNDFVRQKRFNINAMYRFRDGALRGTSVGLAYRWREAPTIGVLAVPFIDDGVQVGFKPDTSKFIKGKAEKSIDLTLSHSGRFRPISNSRYTVRLIARNLFPGDNIVPAAIDSFTGETLTAIRTNGRQFVVSFELKM
ncbi:hypothetical protein G0Q06_01000 [Puniceicoccales bacterium CK1056]|uniref:TonB-dependent receptor plug domain-containing protein n=1 Tax=Oceanipulchritudo coccoides TaxID=2706888 RepID=A0A6B2LZS3_9BACT|nr:hypothetical protein [Oceanipulchritudo coccoides]NDV61020.1 hypothetical protein [Oceanipulchritudo coccoides]